MSSEKEVGRYCFASFVVLSFPVYLGPGMYNAVISSPRVSRTLQEALKLLVNI